MGRESVFALRGWPVHTRTCQRCQEAKTIRGVWYALATRRGEAPQFLCESCYVRATVLPA